MIRMQVHWGPMSQMCSMRTGDVSVIERMGVAHNHPKLDHFHIEALGFRDPQKGPHMDMINR